MPSEEQPGAAHIYLINDLWPAGDKLFVSSIIPPTSLGSPEHPHAELLFDRKTFRPGRAMIVLAYFMRAGDGPSYIRDTARNTNAASNNYNDVTVD